MNLTSGSCYQTLHMPNTDTHIGAVYTTWVKYSTGGNSIDVATCHSKDHGDIPGYHIGGLCYFEYDHNELSTSNWSLVGVINGDFSFSKTYTCAIFGGYQNDFEKPLFHCAGVFSGLLIPGKLDIPTETCWFANTNSKTFSVILAA